MTDDLFSFFNIPKTSIPERTSNDFETTLVKSIPYIQTSRGFAYDQFFLSNIIIDEIMYIINASNSPDEFLISFSNERLDLAIRNKFDIKDLELSKYTQDTLKNLENIGIEKNKDYKIVKYDCGKDEDAEEPQIALETEKKEESEEEESEEEVSEEEVSEDEVGTEEETEEPKVEEKPLEKEEEEEEEVFEIEIDDVTYFATHEENGILYEITSDGDVGKKVGIIKDGEPIFN